MLAAWNVARRASATDINPRGTRRITMRRQSLAMTLGMLAIAAASFAAPAKAREAWAAGSLEKFDATAKSVVVKQGTHEMTFALATDAHLMQGKKALQPNDLAGDIGHRVKVRYTLDGATKRADRIEIQGTAPVSASNATVKR
jgi:hypothetical protein